MTRNKNRNKMRKQKRSNQRFAEDEAVIRYFEVRALDQLTADGKNAFTARAFNFNPLGSFTRDWVFNKADSYESYRISNITVTATPYTNLHTNMCQVNFYSRYDPFYNETDNDVDGSKQILFSDNTRFHTFLPRGFCTLFNGAPKLKRTSGSTDTSPLLPSNLQWYNTSDLWNNNLQNRWNLGTYLANGPAETKDYEFRLCARVTFKFRGRKGPNFADSVRMREANRGVEWMIPIVSFDNNDVTKRQTEKFLDSHNVKDFKTMKRYSVAGRPISDDEK